MLIGSFLYYMFLIITYFLVVIILILLLSKLNSILERALEFKASEKATTVLILLNLAFPGFIIYQIDNATSKVYVIENNSCESFYLIGKNRFELLNNKSIMLNPGNGTLLINNTPSLLYIETVFYGKLTYSRKESSIISINPFSLTNSGSIDYILTNPPESISTQRSNNILMDEEVRSWLHF